MNRVVTAFLVAGLVLAAPATLLSESQSAASAESAEIAVIVHEENSMSSLSLKELSRLYLGKTTIFPDDTRVQLGEDSATEEEFYRVVLNWSPVKVAKHWIKQVFSGASGSPPHRFKRVRDIADFVDDNRGAICFLSADKLDSTMNVISIEGLRPGDDGYPLR
ncbi:MAG: hypothetical protein ACE5GA_10405 [Candidatus Zixiibacteriota bacterium]